MKIANNILNKWGKGSTTMPKDGSGSSQYVGRVDIAFEKHQRKNKKN